MKKFKRAQSRNEALASTLRIILTVLSLALITIVVWFIATEGIDGVIAWFKGKWFALIIVLAVIGASAVLWVIKLAKSVKSLSEEENE